MDGSQGDGFGAGRLFVADARVGIGVLNLMRLQALQRVFGVSRGQANLLTFVLALSAGEVAATAARAMFRMPNVTGDHVAMGGFAFRGMAAGLGGPQAAAVPGVGVLFGVALAGGIVVPRLRRAAKDARAFERRVRVGRERRYADARRILRERTSAMRGEAEPAAAP